MYLIILLFSRIWKVKQEVRKLQMPIKIVGIDKYSTLEAAKLKAKYPVAYADCFASVLAISKNIRVVTGDPEFRKLEKEVKFSPLRSYRSWEDRNDHQTGQRIKH